MSKIMNLSKQKILDLSIDDLDLEKYLSVLNETIIHNLKISICYTNAHVTNLSNRDPELLSALNRFDINYADGFGLSFASRLLYGIKINRFTLSEHVFEVFKVFEEKGWKIFLLGGEKEIIEFAVLRTRKMYPRLILSGFLNGYDQLNDKTIEIINNSSTNILLVGLGTPKQELWVQENQGKLNVNIVNCVGDLFSIIAGKRIRGPKMLRDNGFEWFFRLLQHPIKFFNRYVIGIPIFIYLIVKCKIIDFTKK